MFALLLQPERLNLMIITWEAVTAICAAVLVLCAALAYYVRSVIRTEIGVLLLKLNGIYRRSELCDAFRAKQASGAVAAEATHAAVTVAADAARAAHTLVVEAAEAARDLRDDQSQRISRIEAALAKT
jgi:hypothetical protein